MNKQTEALRMAIEVLEKLSYEYGRLLDGDQDYGLLPSEINADIIKTYYVKRTCQEALAQPADGIELEWYCKGWDDAEKDLATQEPKSPTILARLPNGETASNVYEAYKAGLKEGKAETQEPVTHVIGLDNDGKEVVVKLQKPLYTTPPSREWVGLSNTEIEEVFNLGHKNFKEFARVIEAKLKEKNG